MSAEWYPRLGDVPGVDYRPPLKVERTSITGHDFQPEVGGYTDAEGQKHSYLSWGWKEVPLRPGADPDTDWASEELAAPVVEHLRDAVEYDPAPSPQLLARLREALELPGAPEDYARAIRQTQQHLWPRRLAEPEVLPTIEFLAWLHVRLAIAHPAGAGILIQLSEGGERYCRPSGFETLIRLYRTEGYLKDALAVAELERQHFPAEETDLMDIRSRLELVGSESSG
jgi:hypothetical protein